MHRDPSKHSVSLRAVAILIENEAFGDVVHNVCSR